MNPQPLTNSPSPADLHKNWLASLLLRQHRTWFGRFRLHLQRLLALGRGGRKRLERKAAVSLGGAALLLALGAGMLRPVPVYAASITVDNGVVVIADDGFCGLQEAIISANTDTASGATYGECIAGSGADTIYLPAAGLFTLTTAPNFYFGSDTALPLVSSEITIEGNGSTITRDSLAGSFRFMAINSVGDLTLNDTTVSGGLSEEHGGAIFLREGDLEINDSTFDDNSTIYYDYGGALFNNDGDVTIRNSTFTNNYAQDEGGAIANYHGTMDISYSTFSGNSAGDDGGAIVSYNGMLTIANSTFTLNGARTGGALYLDGTTIVANSTFSDNSAEVGGGIFIDEAGVTISRSVVSGNTASISGNEISAFSVFGSPANSFNIFGHSSETTSQALYNVTPDATDLLATSDGTNPTVLAAILSPTLANNGGPTETMALVANSPAIDFIPTADCTPAPVNGVDQRGEPRGVDIPGTGSDTTNLCDVGAYEMQPPPGVGAFCPANNAGVGDLLTEAIGTGQGSATKGYRTRKLVVPNLADVDSLYGQLAAVDVGVMKYVRFRYPNGTNVKLIPPTSPAFTYHAVDWWGSDLTPSSFIKGQFFWGNKGNKSPRAFVLWPTYATAAPYANVFETFDESSENHVANAVGFFSTQTQTLAIPATTADGADVNMTIAVVDVDGNGRSVILTVEAGGVSEVRVISAPNQKNLLNLEEFTLPDVPAGTDEVTITLESPPVGIDYALGGDSAAMIGAAANYECEVP